MDESDRSMARAQLEKLRAERDGVGKRLGELDARIERVRWSLQDDLDRRVAALEREFRRFSSAEAGSSDSAQSACTSPSAGSTIAAPPKQQPSSGLPSPAPESLGSTRPAQSVSAPRPPGFAPASPPPPGSVPASPPTGAPASSPRVLGEWSTVGVVPLWAGPDRNAPAMFRVDTGTRLLLTELRLGNRVQVVYRNQLFWVDHTWLVPAAPLGRTGRPPVHPGGDGPARPAQSVGAMPPAPAKSAQSRPDGQPAAQAHPQQAAGFAVPQAVAAKSAAPPHAAEGRPPAWQRPGFMPKVLALVGGAVTLIGLAFFLGYLASEGWFPPAARTISAAVLAGVLVVGGFVVRGRDPQNVGAPILAATGVAAGFLAVVAATVIYGWLPMLAGAGLAGLIGLAGLALARRWHNQWMGLVAVLGGLSLSAYIGQYQRLETATLMVILTGATLWFERGSGWRLFPFARVLPTWWVLTNLCWSSVFGTPETRWWLVGLGLTFALLGLVAALIAPEEPPAGQRIALGLLVPMTLPVAMAGRVLQDSVAAALVLGCVAVVLVVIGFLPKVQQRVRWTCVPLGAGFVMLAVLAGTDPRYLGVLTLVLACGYLAVAVQSKSPVSFVVGGVLATFGVLAWLPQLAAIFSPYAAQVAEPENIAQSLAGIGAVVLATLAGIRWLGEVCPWLVYAPWAVAVAMGSVAVIEAGSWIGGVVGNAAAGFQIGQATTSIAWMGLCVLFLQRGLSTGKDPAIWLRLAVATSVLAVAKLFLLDLAMLDTIARVGAFVVVGLLLLFVGVRYARAWERVHGSGELSVPGPVPNVPIVQQALQTVAVPAPGTFLPPEGGGSVPQAREPEEREVHPPQDAEERAEPDDEMSGPASPPDTSPTSPSPDDTAPNGA